MKNIITHRCGWFDAYPKILGRISLGRVRESAGTNVVRIRVGMYAKIIKIVIGGSILLIFALQIRPLR